MKKKLVVFGDSWPWGSDLQLGGKTYGQLIAEHKGIEFQNYSHPSTASSHPNQAGHQLIANTLTDWIK